jgi:hypothetical protein
MNPKVHTLVFKGKKLSFRKSVKSSVKLSPKYKARRETFIKVQIQRYRLRFSKEKRKKQLNLCQSVKSNVQTTFSKGKMKKQLSLHQSTKLSVTPL